MFSNTTYLEWAEKPAAATTDLQIFKTETSQQQQQQQQQPQQQQPQQQPQQQHWQKYNKIPN